MNRPHLSRRFWVGIVWIGALYAAIGLTIAVIYGIGAGTVR